MGGREEARMLHRHEASVEEGRVEGGRVDDGNKRGRNGARHGRREASFFFGVCIWLVMTFNYPVLWVRVKGQG